jgi:hypothetical protein
VNPRPWPARIALLAGGAGVALAVAEAVVRLFSLAPTTVVPLADEATFVRIPGVFAPSRRTERAGFDVRYDVTIDALGYRADPAGPAAPDALQIVFVGDSFVFGDGVRDDDTWPVRLRAALACARPVAVHNAGVPGGSLPEAIAMTDRARGLAPDAVVGATTVQNDVRDLAGPAYWSRMAERRRAGRARDVALRTLSHVGLWNLLRHARESVRVRALAAVPAEVLADARARYAEMLRAWVARLERDGLPLVLAVYPSWTMLTTNDRALHGWVVATARGAGLDPIDLWPVLARDGRAPGELYLVPRDMHPSRTGYELAARAVALALRAQVPAFGDCRVR